MQLIVGIVGVILLVTAIVRASTSGLTWLLFRWRLESRLAAASIILLLVLAAKHLTR